MVTSKELAALFKALAHPKRLAILNALKDKELCVCEMEEALHLRQAYVSQQLTILREAGLVCFRKDGWNVAYRISRPEVYELLELAEAIHSQLGPCAMTPEAFASDGVVCQGSEVVRAEEPPVQLCQAPCAPDDIYRQMRR